MARIDDLFVSAQSAANAFTAELGDLYMKLKQDTADVVNKVQADVQGAIADTVAVVSEVKSDVTDAVKKTAQEIDDELTALEDKYEALQKKWETDRSDDGDRTLGVSLLQSIRAKLAEFKAKQKEENNA